VTVALTVKSKTVILMLMSHYISTQFVMLLEFRFLMVYS